VTYGVPAFRDRSGASLIVNPRVSFEHAAEVAESKSALPGALRNLSRASRILSDKTKHGVVMPLADQLRQSRIAQPKERFLSRAAVRHVRPRVAVQQRNIPLDGRRKLRVMRSFRAAKAAVGYG
jgi:hypothetical protein